MFSVCISLMIDVTEHVSKNLLASHLSLVNYVLNSFACLKIELLLHWFYECFMNSWLCAIDCKNTYAVSVSIKNFCQNIRLLLLVVNAWGIEWNSSKTNVYLIWCNLTLRIENVCFFVKNLPIVWRVLTFFLLNV